MNLLITGAWQEAKKYIPQLAQHHVVIFMQQEKDPLPCDPAWPEGIICNGLFLTHPIDTFTSLRYLQLTSAGYDRVDMDYVHQHRIEIHNARGVYSIPMAEYAVGTVLAIYRGLYQFHDNQKVHKWEKNRNLRELNGQTVLIVGCGSVGTECAKRFKAFGCKILGIDISPREDENYDKIQPLEELDHALPVSDIIILTLPLTEKTKGIIDADRLNLIHGLLINISRGAIIDSKALATWNGEAILDVFEEEPLPTESILWNKGNIIITPHNSFVGGNNNQRLGTLILENLEGLML